MRRAIYFGALLMLTACASKPFKYAPHRVDLNPHTAPDYSQLASWAAHPNKVDVSDSVPTFLKPTHLDTSVDVFFIHPTSYSDPSFSAGWNASLNDPTINLKTDGGSILYQASIFNVARVFAPRYRQAHYNVYLPNADTGLTRTALTVAYSDVARAFLYYLKYENKDRPFIIASHSQGTTHAKQLIRDFVEQSALKNKLVAAYLVGMPVEPNYFKQIFICKTPTQTGCFCTWRTFKSGYLPKYVRLNPDIALITNPISFSDTQPSIDRSKNPGSVLKNFNKSYQSLVGATNHNGVIWTNKPHFFGSIFLRTKNYHIADYNFYYRSVRENVKIRIEAYKQNKGY